MPIDSFETDGVAARLHAKALVWDCHGCMPLRTDDTYLPQLLRYKKAGVSIIHINVGAANIGLEQQFRIASFMHWWRSKTFPGQ